MKRILFVCLGNICRSPTAEAVFRARSEAAGLSLHIDSAGTGGWHQGHPPDGRARAAAEARGYSMAGQSGRKVAAEDFRDFDLILAMDGSNLDDLQAMVPAGSTAALKLFLDYAPQRGEGEVPDPYYGGDDGFEHVLDLIEDASDGLIAAHARFKG